MNRSVDFFDTQFRKQVASRDFALNPFETLALPFTHGRVLDLGCGLGNLSIAAARNGAHATAVDASTTAVVRIAETSLAEIKAHVASGGVAIVNVLVEGTTYMEMFQPGAYYLFAPDEIERSFAGWKIELARRDDFDAPGGTKKAFSTVVARRP